MSRIASSLRVVAELPLNLLVVQVGRSVGTDAVLARNDHARGLPHQARSDALLAELNAYTEMPDLRYEHVWRKGDLIMFDNWCSSHARTFYPPEQRRTLRRSMVKGQKLYE